MLVDKYKDRVFAEKITKKIKEVQPDYPIKFMHVCGTHEQIISRYGLRTLLPDNIEIIAGPGCPVCVVPSKEIDEAIYLARDGVILATFGDMIRVPSSEKSLSQVKAEGADVRIVYGPNDAVNIAKRNPSKDVVFFSVGFETTAPTIAAEILKEPPENFSILTAHRLIPPSMELLMGIGDLNIDGFICPGHVATIIGIKPFRLFPETYGMPTVIAGFEPIDVLLSLYLLLSQLKEGKIKVENEYSRSVKEEGNLKALEIMNEVFEIYSTSWRGMGRIPNSGLKVRDDFSRFDARRKYDIRVTESIDIHPGCNCHLVMVGKLYPHECRLFAKACTPQTPKGPCMVSIEGSCRISYKYGRL